MTRLSRIGLSPLLKLGLLGLAAPAVCLAAAASIASCSSKSSGGGANGPSADGGGATDSGSSADGGGGGDGGVTDTGATVPVADAGTVSIARDGGAPISPFAFGQNYWDWVDWDGTGMTGVTGTETSAAALKLNVLRAGGNNNDNGNPVPFAGPQIDAFVSYCKAVGAQPILQVPVIANDTDGGLATAQTAADLVTYANGTKGYGIQYWEIGNEPDLYPQNYDSGVPLTAQDFCTTFASFATAMRAANAAATDGGTPMTILGPELSYSYIPSADWLTPFLDGCKDSVDIVAVHRYPFSGKSLSPNGALNDVANFRATVKSLSTIVTNHARPGTPLAITETNDSYDYDPSVYSANGLLAAPGTIYAALWVADIAGASLESHLWTTAFWDLGDNAAGASVLGFLQTQQPTPSYFTEQMVSANLHGTTVVPSAVPRGFSVYASYDPAGAQTTVVVINKTTTASSVSIAIDSLPVQTFAYPALSVSLLTVPDDVGSGAGAVHLQQYDGAQSDAGVGPIMVQ